MLLDESARSVLAAYNPAWPVRAHVASRFISCPLGPVIESAPDRGHLIDFGCGHGAVALLLALRKPELRIFGIDIDPDKLSAARSAAWTLGVADRVAFGTSDEVPAWEQRTEPMGLDAVIFVDVLYLLGRAEAVSALERLAGCVRPGGVAVVKEMGDSPGWKARWNLVQERMAVELFGYTSGRFVDMLAPTEIRGALESRGMHVEERSLDRYRPHPHHLFVGTREATA